MMRNNQELQIQAPRVFGVMLPEHLVQAGALVPPVLEWCCTQVIVVVVVVFLLSNPYLHLKNKRVVLLLL